MMKFLLGRKLGMTTLQDAEQGALNVTLIECDTNMVSLLRTPERDGYTAVQIEAMKTSKRKLTKEFRLDAPQVSQEDAEKELAAYEVGKTLDVSVFSVGDVVNVTGVSKGKGFQGVVKRHSFKGSPRTHGHKHDLRAPGSIGAQQPQHVIKGKRMAGRMGADRSTMQNLTIVLIDETKNLIAVKGAVAGVNGRMVEVWARS
ncbi:MAG: 50S ribosomal protein L3 [Candidatus Moranbacteria bacterium]|nr:50S ribosomal protein L3 [Candidatus Moranbacteria bacterium]